MSVVLIKSRSYDGPSIWSQRTVTRLTVTLDAEECGDASVIANLTAGLPGLLDELAIASSPKAPLDVFPTSPDTTTAALIGILAINLQRLAGIDVQFHTCRSADRPETHEIVFEHPHPVIGGSAGKLAVRLTIALVGRQSVADAINEYRSGFIPLVTARWNVTTSQPIVAFSRQRGIPVSHVDPRGRLIDLGNGAYRKRIIGSTTSLLSSLAEEISQDKFLTRSYLLAAGLPVPEAGVARNVEHGVQIAGRIGYPVVVKPADSGGATGVSLNLQTEEQVRERFAVAQRGSNSGRVLIERYVEGRDYRVAVVDGALISVVETQPAHIVGNGLHSTRALIEAENAKPGRGVRTTDTRRPITIDDEVVWYLASFGQSLDDIPGEGEVVRLRLWPNMANGGVSIDRTDYVHPDNVAIILQAAATVGLDVTTMDVISPNIAQSMWEYGGAILDVNAHSGFRMQRYPTMGKPRDPFPAIVGMLFPPGKPVRAPIIAVIGDGAGQTCEQLAIALAATGKVVGLATESKLAVGGMELKGVDRRGANGIRTILNNPAVEIAVAEVTPGGIVEEGLGFDYCDAAIVLSLSGLETPFGQPVESVVTNLLDANGMLVLDTGELAAHSLAESTAASVIDRHQATTTEWLDQIVATISSPD